MNFDRSTQKSKKICVLMGSLWPKYIMFELKQYRGVIFHDTEGRCKIWRKNGLWFEKWHEKFDKFSPEHLKVSVLGLWWDLFVQSRKCMSLKFTETYVSWQWRMMQNLKRNWLVIWKLTWGIWQILTLTPKNLKKLLFNWLLWPKYMMLEIKKSTEELCLMALKIDAKFKGKLACALKNDMRNLANLRRLK